jgi:hypothetical protein
MEDPSCDIYPTSDGKYRVFFHDDHNCMLINLDGQWDWENESNPRVFRFINRFLPQKEQFKNLPDNVQRVIIEEWGMW